ncbi:MAG TPA: twin-arginine translocase subunit TatC [Candidatus Saccharimonadales bacterium]|nr:twin-arginine translocase subunit TatC [Candidatus Saccharimonadales bacterium]
MTAGRKNKNQTTRATTKKRRNSAEDRLQPFIEHVRELRRRVFYIALSIVAFSIAAYAVEHQLINFLLKPSNGQQFIYTSPVGGLNFLFKVCLYVGIAASLPVIVYQFLRYVEPLLKRSSTRFIYWGTFSSGVLALVGMAFGYFIGLPAALHFLLHQFHTAQIHPLLTIDEYMSFVTLYMFGSALMFQVPLIVLFINRIKPMTPQKLLHYEKWVLILSFVLAFIMDPTPNVIDQVFIALPIVLSYQLSIGVIWWQHSHSRRTKVSQLRAQDATAQAERLERASHLRPLVASSPLPVAEAPAAPAPVALASSSTLAARMSRPSRTYDSPMFTRAYSLPRRPYIDI